MQYHLVCSAVSDQHSYFLELFQSLKYNVNAILMNNAKECSILNHFGVPNKSVSQNFHCLPLETSAKTLQFRQ